MKLIPSQHFKSRIAERGILWTECEETVRKPDRKTVYGRGDIGGIKYKFEKDYADKTIIVVVGDRLPKSDNVLCITAWKK